MTVPIKNTDTITFTHEEIKELLDFSKENERLDRNIETLNKIHEDCAIIHESNAQLSDLFQKTIDESNLRRARMRAEEIESARFSRNLAIGGVATVFFSSVASYFFWR